MSELIHADDLAYGIEKEYPGIVRGKDYWVAHPVDANRIQCGDAYIVEWQHPTYTKPERILFLQVWKRWKDESIVVRVSAHLRGMRNVMLRGADAQIALSEDRGNGEQAKAWRTYRQALRDIPQQSGFPLSVTWPKSPNATNH